MSETLMSHPDGSGRVIPHAIWATLKPQYDARRTAFEDGPGKHLSSEGGRAATASMFMQSTPVDRVEIAAPVGKFVDPSLTDARVDARVNGELDGQANKHGGVDFAVRAPNVYGRPIISPHKFFG